MAPITTYTERIANRVEAAMSERGINLHQMSVRAHIPRTTLRNQLAGAAQFKVEQLFRVCQVLGVELSDMLRELDEDAA